MTNTPSSPVLLICADEDTATDVLQRLYERGISVVGPAATARLAMALAGQTFARSAIMVGETAGRRTAAQLAEELQRTWGIECVCLGLPEDPLQASSDAEGEPADVSVH